MERKVFARVVATTLDLDLKILPVIVILLYYNIPYVYMQMLPLPCMQVLFDTNTISIVDFLLNADTDTYYGINTSLIILILITNFVIFVLRSTVDTLGIVVYVVLWHS